MRVHIRSGGANSKTCVFIYYFTHTKLGVDGLNPQ